MQLLSVIKDIYGDVNFYSFSSGSSLQGWEIAPDWVIEHAIIKDRDGKLSFLDSRFGVPYLMESSSLKL